MRALLERHIEIKVLRPWTRTFCFLPRRAAARDDSGATEGARAGGEAGVVVEAPVGSAVGGVGGVANPQTM
jgi:hypothetical protein